MQSKTFSAVTCLIALGYFVDVFVGMLLIYADYEHEGGSEFQSSEDSYRLTDRPYDIVEIALLMICIINGVLEFSLTWKDSNSKVRVMQVKFLGSWWHSTPIDFEGLRPRSDPDPPPSSPLRSGHILHQPNPRGLPKIEVRAKVAIPAVHSFAALPQKGK